MRNACVRVNSTAEKFTRSRRDVAISGRTIVDAGVEVSRLLSSHLLNWTFAAKLPVFFSLVGCASSHLSRGSPPLQDLHKNWVEFMGHIEVCVL